METSHDHDHDHHDHHDYTQTGAAQTGTATHPFERSGRVARRRGRGGDGGDGGDWGRSQGGHHGGGGLRAAGGGSRRGCGCLALVTLLLDADGPVEDVVVHVALAVEEIAKELAEIRVVGTILEAELAAVVEIGRELRWE
jgi:hypothetical protein